MNINFTHTKEPMLATLKHVLIFSVVLLAAGCNSEDSGAENQQDPGTPPSLTSEEQGRTITLTGDQVDNLDIQIYTIGEDTVSFYIDAPGQVFAAPERISVVSAPINGRISTIFVHEGERVTKGDPLLELESLEFANLVADYLEATAEITYQEQQVERLEVLTEEKISPQRTLERAQADLRRAKTRQSAALARLRAVGITKDVIENWDPFMSEPQATLTLYAPITGVLNQHLIELGESVNAYEKLLDIIDNTEVLVRGFVAPTDASFLQPGTDMVITERAESNGNDSRRLEATVTTINPALDETNKSIVLNSIVQTRSGWPVVGQNVRLRYAAQPSATTISIPLSAIQFEGSDATVFVQRSPREYEKRTVGIARMTSDQAIINSGLEQGEKVAVSQVFSLKALERFEQFAD